MFGNQLGREALLGATTQGAPHHLLLDQIQQYWYHQDPGCHATRVAGLGKPFDEATQAGFYLEATACF